MNIEDFQAMEIISVSLYQKIDEFDKLYDEDFPLFIKYAASLVKYTEKFAKTDLVDEEWLIERIELCIRLLLYFTLDANAANQQWATEQVASILKKLQSLGLEDPQYSEDLNQFQKCLSSDETDTSKESKDKLFSLFELELIQIY
ncbi:MAG: hypothetical protein ABI597_11295 [Gammaproteobacteria bacterium]